MDIYIKLVTLGKKFSKDVPSLGKLRHVRTGKKHFPYKKAHFSRSPREDVREREERRGQNHVAYLWKTFFVHMVHHHNFIVKCSAAPSRTKQQMRDNPTFNGSRNTEAVMQSEP